MKIDLIFPDPSHNTCLAISRQMFNYDSLSKDEIVDMLERCGANLKLEGHAKVFCSAVQLLSLLKAVPISTVTTTSE